MTAAELWQSAARDARDTVNLLIPEMEPDEVPSRIVKALEKARSTTSALEALQRLTVGVPEPKRGDA